MVVVTASFGCEMFCCGVILSIKKKPWCYSVYTVSWKFCLNTLLKDKILMTFIVALIRENPNCCYNNSIDFCLAFSFCIYSAVMTAYVLLFVCSAPPPPPPLLYNTDWPSFYF